MSVEHFLYFFRICLFMLMLSMIYHQSKIFWNSNKETVADYWRQIQDWFKRVVE